MQSIKEHNLKANHNYKISSSSTTISVCNLSKNTIWKQITTCSSYQIKTKALYAIYQRTQSESKSQLWITALAILNVCMQSIKEHNLKANHNTDWLWLWARGSVCNLSKNTIWKQITTTRPKWHTITLLYAIYQRTQSESKSQPSLRSASERIFCMQSIKEHNLKANHNPQPSQAALFRSVCNLSKNTIWKQITTLTVLFMLPIGLYAIYQRTQSESKSQLANPVIFKTLICMQSIKEHNLKANHNVDPLAILICNLYAIYQRTQSESKSQRGVCTLQN